MKNFYSGLQPIKSVQCLIVFYLTLFLMGSAQRSEAQGSYRADTGSRIDILTNSENTLNEINNFSAQGNFMIKDGMLDEVSVFSLNLPISKSSHQSSITDSINFRLTHVMIMPTLKKIHFVGILKVGELSSRTELFFDFMVNSDQSITLNGQKHVVLKEYNKVTFANTASLPQKDIDLKLNMKLILKNDPPVMLSSAAAKSGSR